jgi:hypothetical protein
MPMSEPVSADRGDDPGSQTGDEGELHPAELLASLVNADAGGGRRTTAVESSQPPAAHGPRKIEEVQPGARAFAAPPSAAPAAAPESDVSVLLRAVQGVRAAWPYLQRLLPLLDGNVVTALSNLLGLKLGPSGPPPKPVDLGPVEGGITELKTQQRELRSIVLDQDSLIKRLVEQLDQVREATDRNTSEQQDLIDELKTAGRKLNVVAFLAFALLAASIALNVVLYLQIHRLLP